MSKEHVEGIVEVGLGAGQGIHLLDGHLKELATGGGHALERLFDFREPDLPFLNHFFEFDTGLASNLCQLGPDRDTSVGELHQVDREGLTLGLNGTVQIGKVFDRNIQTSRDV